jgi:hypothetical protein
MEPKKFGSIALGRRRKCQQRPSTDFRRDWLSVRAMPGGGGGDGEKEAKKGENQLKKFFKLKFIEAAQLSRELSEQMNAMNRAEMERQKASQEVDFGRKA